MASAEGTGGIRQCYNDIIKADSTGDYDRALKACNRLLKKFPKEAKHVYKCKLVALIQLGQFDNALTLLKKTSANEMGPVSFEKAYVHYRLNQNSEAIEELSKCEKNDVRAIELKAQLDYRLDQYQGASDGYTYLLKNLSDDNDDERKANMIAVQAQLASTGLKSESSLISDLDTFEQLYNAACMDIEEERFDEALKRLDKALPICHETLIDSGLNEEEVEEEAASLALQRAFVLHRMGRVSEAAEVYHKTESIKPSDASVLAAVLNNLASLPSFNLGDSRKKLKGALQVEKAKLSRRQRVTLLLNQALVLLISNQREPSKRILEELLNDYGTSREAQLMEAALHWKNGDADKAVSALPSNDPMSCLSRVHILVNLGKLDDAYGQLASLSAELQSMPAILSLSAALLHGNGNSDKAIEVMEKAKAGWNGEALASVLNKISMIESSRDRHRSTATNLEQLSRLRPSDIGVTCRLIRAYSHFDSAKADELREKAFPDGKSEDMDVDQLEDSDWILYGEKYKQRKEAKEGHAIDDAEIVTGKLRNRKRKRTILPKNFDPNIQPDPERWLPKQERTAYKKRRKNREREVGRGTQGAAAPSVEYKGADPTSSPRPTTVIPTEGPRQQRPAQQKKKKGKSGKW